MSEPYSHLTLFHHVAEYAVDNPGYLRDPLAEGHLALTPEVFYQRLYVERPKVEQELRDAILTSAQNICVLGRGGAGKTSLVTKVLRDLASQQQNLIFRFDFKEIADSEEVQAVEKAYQDAEELNESLAPIIRKHVMTKLKRFVTTSEKLTLDELTVQLVRDGRKSIYEEDPDTEDTRSDLHTQFERQSRSGVWDKDRRFNDWLDAQVKANAPVIMDILTHLTQKLTPKTLLLAMVETLKPQAVHKAILLFDNVDSIQGRRLRIALRQFARSYSKNVGEYAKIIVCVRHENRARNLMNRNLMTEDVVPENSPHDPWAHIFEIIDLDNHYEILTGRAHTDKNAAAADKAAEDAEVLDADDAPAVLYYQAITDKRIEYLEERVRTANIPVREPQKLETLRRRCDIVLEMRHVQDTLSRLTNFDMRAMLVTLANFVEDLDKRTDVQLDQIEQAIHIERNSDRRKRLVDEWGYRIESHLYLFIANMGSGPSSLFDPSLYNIAKWVVGWQKQEKQAVLLMAPRLTLTCLYNGAGIKGGHRAAISNLVATKQILDQCERIGIPRETTDIILKSFWQEVSARRFVETTRHYNDEELFDQQVWGKDSLVPTPRTRLLLEVMELKFHYLLALMSREKIVLPDQEQPFHYDVQKPVTAATIGAVLMFICLVGRMEMEMLENVQQSAFAQDNPRWLSDFREEFCVYQTGGSYFEDDRGNLLTDNLFATCLKFLTTLHWHSYFNGVVQEEMIVEYQRARDRFNALAVAIADGKTSALVAASLNRGINTDVFSKKG